MNVNHQLLFGYENGNDQFTKALLHFTGADGSTTITNSAAGGSSTWAVANQAQVDNSQSKFGGTACAFDGTGDFIASTGHADYAFGTGDFTIDFWLRLTNVGVAQIIYDSRPSATQGFYPTIYLNSSSKIIFFNNNTDRITSTTSLVVNTWTHIAVTRQGTSSRLFMNGTQEGSTFSDSATYLIGASRPAIGVSGNDGGSGMNGWVDEVRVTKGVARWTSNFTPWGKAYG